MSNDLFIMMFRTSYQILNSSVKEVKHSDSLLVSEKGGNCLNWILGHILISRNDLLQYLGAEKNEDLQEEVYKRGSSGRSSDNYQNFNILKEALDLSQEKLINALEAKPDKFFTQKISKSDHEKVSRASEIAFFHLHEMYHAGQIGLLRRILGYEGIIK